MKLGVKFYNFHVCSAVARFIPINIHVYVSAHKGNLFICQMQITDENLLANFAGEVLPAKFVAKILSEVCSLSMR